MISFRQLKRISVLKSRRGILLLFFWVVKPRIRKQTPGERQNRKIAVKGKVNQITLHWGFASKRKRTLQNIYEATLCGVLIVVTVIFIPNTPPSDDFEFRKTGGAFNAWEEKFSFYLELVICWYNRRNFAPKTGGDSAGGWD